MAGSIGLTDVQSAKYSELFARNGGEGKPLTTNMVAELAVLQDKKDNPELPTGAKTYCKKWLKEQLFRRYAEIRSKYIDKGNLTEEEGFTLLCVQLKLGMVFKNTLRRALNGIEGEWDLLVDEVVYDNKSSWSLDTFPMFETKPDPDYVWQLQGYMTLTDAKKSVLAHTLNDAPEKLIFDAVRWYDDHKQRAKIVNSMVFTQKGWDLARNKFCDTILPEHFNFIPIPDAQRIKTFDVIRDNVAIGNIYHRRNMCDTYVNRVLLPQIGVSK